MLLQGCSCSYDREPCYTYRQADRQTDRQTDRQADRQVRDRQLQTGKRQTVTDR